jgi:tyrosyl-tRNA synthetase
MEEIERMTMHDENPRDAKLWLAYEVVKLYRREQAAAKAREAWVKTFSKKEVPGEMGEIKVKRGTTLLEVVRAAGVSSNSEAMRLFAQGAVKQNGKTAPDPKALAADSDILKIGKKKFVRISLV